MAEKDSTVTTDTGLVWDLPLRCFHWALATCVIASWITAEAGYDYTELHFLLGYTSLGLILFRILWGIFGTTHARFTNFLKGPRATLASIRATWTRQPSQHLGHSPAGGVASVVLILLVGIQASTGLFISDDIFWAGPYNGAVSSATAGSLAGIHHLNFNVLQAFIALHLVTIAWYQWGKRQNLSKPMLTGTKNLAHSSTEAAVANSRLGVALVLALLAGGAIWLLVTLAPPPAPSAYF